MNDTFKALLIIAIILWLMAVLIMLSGCAWHGAKYTGLDSAGKPYTIELTARRFAMGQEVQGFSGEFPGGYKIGFDASKGSESKAMENFLGVLGPLLQTYVKAQPGVVK